MKIDTTRQARSIVGDRPEGRPIGDFYPTPERATLALLDKEIFYGGIWECACGNGAISKVLKDEGYKVDSSDLYDRGYGRIGIDFLNETELRKPNIITNPPFTIAVEFMEHAINLGCDKLALLCKLAFLEGVKRSVKLENSPLKNVYVFRKRLLMTRNGEKPRGSGMIAFAWYIWEKDYDGFPMIGWI